MKIVITGGLGYIGSELSKLYSGYSNKHEIVVIDNQFHSSRVTQLSKWNIKFIQADILNRKDIEPVLKDADLIYHLAGITNVPQVKEASTGDIDKLINKVGTEGSQNIIDLSNENSKIIFPSTHVVFEGIENTITDISEDDETFPVLSYSGSKRQTEKDLFNSNKNFVILRLGSLCGISSDATRLNIMPNLFAKIASQNGQIKLFGGGKQIKSLVTLADTVRCLMFVGENSEINREVFHCVNENYTVKEVADICKNINPNLNLVDTDDEIPNLGYTLSNKKILETGFEFTHTVKKSLQEMITSWKSGNQLLSNEYIFQGQDNFEDNRGIISNYYLEDPVNMLGYIESTKGSVRGNHYHPVQYQKCLLISGSYLSVTKNLLDEDSVIETRIVNKGDLSIIPPNVAHTMVFLEDSVFINLVNGEREKENYGITHTFQYDLVDESLSKIYLENFRDSCRVCKNKKLINYLSLGLSPLANNLLSAKNEIAQQYPLELYYCKICSNSQLGIVVPPEKMFDDYLYLSSTSKQFQDHFVKFAEELVLNYDLDQDSLLVDIGSNDGILLKPLIENNIKSIGVEPAKNLSDKANELGYETINEYFDENTVSNIKKVYGEADIITACNVFAHSDGLFEILDNAFSLLKKGGTFIVEVQYLVSMLEDLSFDNVYHEHVNYWNVTSMKNFLEINGYVLSNVEKIDTHGGSIRCYINKNEDSINSNVEEFITKEKEIGIDKIETYSLFSEKIEKQKKNTLKALKELKKNNGVIAGYGSPAKATTVLNYYGIKTNLIEFTIEDNDLKHNLFIPGVNLPIKSKKDIDLLKIDVVVVLAWNFFDIIQRNNKDLFSKGTSFTTLNNLNSE